MVEYTVDREGENSPAARLKLNLEGSASLVLNGHVVLIPSMAGNLNERRCHRTGV